jgi:hypothetical protein
LKVKLDLLGAIVAHIIFISSIITFVARMKLGAGPGHWIGVPILLMAFPLVYLLIRAPSDERSPLYFIQIVAMLAWLTALFLLDYVFKIDFRRTQWMVIAYVMLYFAGIGGMIGLAAQAGKGWAISATVLFFVAGILAFVQRGVTGF